MPSSMIHLLTAHKVKTVPDALFCIGTLAPDGVSDRAQKDRSHYRSHPDRMAALTALAGKTSPDDAFLEGALLHLFTDWLWDEQSFVPYKAAHETVNPDWFLAYRKEISLASIWIFHHSDWAMPAYERMLAVPLSCYGHPEGIPPEAARAYIERNFNFHAQNNTAPSSVFTQEYVEGFTGAAAKEYIKWRNSVG